MAKLTLRVEFGGERAIGPGKIRLLELIRDHGSISAAGRAMGMSYKRAWTLVDNLNRCFREVVVSTQLGGRAGGGAALTRFGESLVENYRAIEAESEAAVKARLRALQAELSSATPQKHPQSARARRH